MGDRTGIEYLVDRQGRRGATWAPVSGCKPISEGCAHCWAKTVSETRLAGQFGYDVEHPFRVTTHRERLSLPLRWGRPRNIATVFMGDLFHEDVPFSYMAAVYGVMAAAWWHTFVVCTKRPKRAREFFAWLDGGPLSQFQLVFDHSGDEISKQEGMGTPGWMRSGGGFAFDEEHPAPEPTWPPANVVFLFSAENQQRFDERVEDALAVPAAVHGVSLEPLLGPVDLDRGNACFDRRAVIRHMVNGPAALNRDQAEEYIAPVGLKWVIAGCERPAHRPAKNDWFCSLRDQCVAAGVPFYLKQAVRGGGRQVVKTPMLDGRQWLERPEVMR